MCGIPMSLLLETVAISLIGEDVSSGGCSCGGDGFGCPTLARLTCTGVEGVGRCVDEDGGILLAVVAAASFRGGDDEVVIFDTGDVAADDRWPSSAPFSIGLEDSGIPQPFLQKVLMFCF